MLIPFESREQWLAKRRELITASDVPAILGWDPRRTAWDVFADKMTGQSMSDNDAMIIGRELESGIASVYAKKTGRKIVNPESGLYVHSDIPWLGATPDRLTWRDENAEDVMPWEPGCPLECKHVGFYNKAAWEDGAPLYVQIQSQIQQACMGAPWGAFCGIVGGSEIHLGDLDFNSEFFESALPHLEEFLRRLRENDPPPVDSPKHLGPVKKLYPLDNGETVELSSEYLDLANQWEAQKTLGKQADEAREELEARIRAAIGAATFGRLPDGTILALKTTQRKGYTCEVKPTSFRTLRRSK